MWISGSLALVGSGRNGFGLSDPRDCHVYLVDGGDEAALVDCGAGVNIGPILDRIAAAGIPGDRVRKIFLTHGHADHAGGAAALRHALGADVLASPEVAQIIQVGDDARASVAVAKRGGGYPADYHLPACVVDGELRDGDRIQVGKLTVQVIETPGHSSGHLCFTVRGRGRDDLFAGDALMFGGRIILQDTWDCDVRSQVASLRRIAEHSFDGFFPAHFSFSACDGRRHVESALAEIDRGAIPTAL